MIERPSGIKIVGVCGGRKYDDRDWLYGYMDREHAVHRFTHVVHGQARGADSLADEWALSRGVQPVRCPANWPRFDNSAGHIRNNLMGQLPIQILYAFPGGNGTAGMIAVAQKRGIQVIGVLARSA